MRISNRPIIFVIAISACAFVGLFIFCAMQFSNSYNQKLCAGLISTVQEDGVRNRIVFITTDDNKRYLKVANNNLEVTDSWEIDIPGNERLSKLIVLDKDKWFISDNDDSMYLAEVTAKGDLTITDFKEIESFIDELHQIKGGGCFLIDWVDHQAMIYRYVVNEEGVLVETMFPAVSDGVQFLVVDADNMLVLTSLNGSKVVKIQASEIEELVTVNSKETVWRIAYDAISDEVILVVEPGSVTEIKGAHIVRLPREENRINEQLMLDSPIVNGQVTQVYDSQGYDIVVYNSYSNMLQFNCSIIRNGRETKLYSSYNGQPQIVAVLSDSLILFDDCLYRVMY